MNRNYQRGLAQFFRSLAGMFVPFRVWVGELKDTNVLRADVLAGIDQGLVDVLRAEMAIA